MTNKKESNTDLKLAVTSGGKKKKKVFGVHPTAAEQTTWVKSEKH